MSPSLLNPYRHKVEELIQRYSLEPTLRDLYVEGSSDAALLRRFLRRRGHRAAVVYEIDGVDIPPQTLREHGLSDGKRDRILFLSSELSKHLPHGTNAVTCVADVDYDVVLRDPSSLDFLFFIDYSGLELYTYEARFLDEVLATAGLGSLSGADILSQLEPILKRLYLIRAAGLALGLNLKWLNSSTETCSLVHGGVRFDESDFIDRLLNKNTAFHEKRKLVEKVAEFEQKAQTCPDARKVIRAHDFAELLAWYLKRRQKGNKEWHDKDLLERFLLAHLQMEDLASHPFFQALETRIS